MFVLKRIVFNLLGICLMFMPLWCTAIAYWYFDKYAIISSIVVLIVSFLVSLFLRSIDSELKNDGISIFCYTDFLSKRKRSKIVYHSVLGRFICISDAKFSKIHVYEQKFLYLRGLDSFYTRNDTTNNWIGMAVKEIIDKEYREIIRKEKIDDKINDMKKWDGYLDTAGKRDDKINKILKKF